MAPFTKAANKAVPARTITAVSREGIFSFSLARGTIAQRVAVSEARMRWLLDAMRADWLRRRRIRFQKPQTASQPSGGRRLDQDRHQDCDEGDGCDHLRAGRLHAQQQASQRRRTDAGFAG